MKTFAGALNEQLDSYFRSILDPDDENFDVLPAAAAFVHPGFRDKLLPPLKKAASVYVKTFLTAAHEREAAKAGEEAPVELEAPPIPAPPQASDQPPGAQYPIKLSFERVSMMGKI